MAPEGQINKFLKSGHFAFKKGKKEMTFFTQGAVSYGSHVIVNLTNCLDVQVEVAQGTYQMFEGIIAFSSKTDKEWKPRQFHITRVETNNQGIIWRVHFKANQEQLVQSGIPVVSNFSWRRGQVKVVIPPKCHSCISFLHAMDKCTWSRVPGVLAIPHELPNLRCITWSHYTSFPPLTKDELGGKEVSESESSDDEEEEVMEGVNEVTSRTQGDVTQATPKARVVQATLKKSTDCSTDTPGEPSTPTPMASSSARIRETTQERGGTTVVSSSPNPSLLSVIQNKGTC
ncbi:hypothetical protein FRB94_011160 [Tulasnella sp. JGI-2019a]|nr:hypothetical protein FRB94_011160 [Tulasnella sp. JGI-2019a]